ncbi:p26 [Cryptophlebia peltastica nucleopolyhedrovirus]|uniref:p26 n=1 Tax=Cryptophlebia peltastica nucleopolyhedrovirus TaxID=2304025 RepID=A0A346RNM7_9ABAC|nr:p26 [Cryptophlebia peltastica nucleopolyhedrovirus]AXS67674.1 p26 [Cryptophlebia peltastica nucleopolyhedrovirus]
MIIKRTMTFLLLLLLCIRNGQNLEINNVNYEKNELKKTVTITKVDGQESFIKIIAPMSRVHDEEYGLLHQFPGVASNIVFPKVSNNSALDVLLNNGDLASFTVDRVYANFHIHKQRLIYGQMYAFALTDFSLANKIYLGAPVFRENRLISVITCRHNDYKNGLVIFPITGIRPEKLVSGQMNFDKSVSFHKFLQGMSVYGTKQLPYVGDSSFMLKRYALTVDQNKNTYRDLPRNINVFYNDHEIVITLSEGEYEIDRVRFDGPLISYNT